MTGFLIMGQLIMSRTSDWGYCFILASSLLFFMMVVNLVKLKPYPEKEGIDLRFNDGEENRDLYLVEENQPADQLFEENEKINFFNAWKIPRVPLYALTFMGLKSTQYGLLFWLPTYLKGHCPSNWKYKGIDCPMGDEQPYISAMFPIGTWIGGVLAGFLSDKIGGRAILMCPMMLISTVLMHSIDGLHN